MIISKIILNIVCGIDTAHIISNKKYIDPIIGAAIIGAGGSLLSGLFGSSSSSKANAQNIALQRETNEMNKTMFYDSLAMQNQWNAENRKFTRDFTKEMFNLENAYNSPESQMQRYLYAGLNPSVAMAGNVSHAGNASATQMSGNINGVPNAPNLAAPQNLFNPTSDLQALADAVSKFGDTYVKLDQNDPIKRQLGAQTEYTFKAIKEKEEQTLFLQLENSFKKKYGDAKARKEVEYLDKLMQKLDSDISYQEKLGILTDAQSWLTNSQNNKLMEELPYVAPQLQALIDYYKSMSNLNDTTAKWTPFNAQTNRIGANAQMKSANAAEINAFSNREVNHALAGLYGVQATRTSCLKALDDTEKAYKGALREVAEYQRDVLREQIPIIQQSAKEAIKRGDYTDAAALFSVIGTLIQGSVNVKVP